MMPGRGFRPWHRWVQIACVILSHATGTLSAGVSEQRENWNYHGQNSQCSTTISVR
jgi:hypothetical protein